MSEKTREVPQLAHATYAHTLVIEITKGLSLLCYLPDQPIVQGQGHITHEYKGHIHEYFC